MTTAPRGRRLLRWLAVVLLVTGLGVVMTLSLREDEGDISNPDVEFVETVPSTPAPPLESTRTPGRHPADDGFSWPQYGYTKNRTHHLPLRGQLRPPFRQAWAETGNVLLEFTPVLCRRSLFLLKNNGALYAISRKDGHVRWKRKLGSLAAASPACGHGTVYAVLLKRFRGSKGGRVVALSASSGRTRWSRKLPSRAESSPLLAGGRLYFGTEDGTVYALRASNGAVRWRYQADGAVKGALALDGGKLFFGDYDGKVHAIRRTNGRKVWKASTRGTRLGLASGNFYSSPAVQYGRVYIGNTDGKVYSYSARDGRLAWRKRTGDYVYASPAVGQVPGGRPTVYVGNYDGDFYALDARSGRVRWKRSLGSKISGAASIVGDLVFVSDLDKRSTWALGARTGRTMWRTNRGAFNAAISDGRRVYFNGYSSLFALEPRSRPFDGGSARRADRRDRARIARRVRDRRRARRERSRHLRSDLHGHRHRHGPRGCHRHRHVYEVRGKAIVLRHKHCHRHTRR